MLFALTFVFAVLNFTCFIVAAYRFLDDFNPVMGILAAMNLAVALVLGYVL
jgi:hypothetical protein